MSTSGGKPFPFSDLDEKMSKSRYGVAYVRSLCGQAGVSCRETSPDEDVKAIDLEVDFDEAAVSVQVKCSAQHRIRGGPTATLPTRASWIEKWNRRRLPVYCVLVLVDPVIQAQWVEHPDDGTWHRSAGFWTRVDGLPKGGRIVIEKNRRLTVETFERWHRELLDALE